MIIGGEGGRGRGVVVITDKTKTTSSPQPVVTQLRHQYWQKGYWTPTPCEAKCPHGIYSLNNYQELLCITHRMDRDSASVLTAAFPSLSWDTVCDLPPHHTKSTS